MTLSPEAVIALDVLRDRTRPLADTMRAIEAVEALADAWRQVRIGITANVTVPLLGTFLRRHALIAGVRTTIVSGRHDDLLGDMERFVAERVDHAVILYAFDNLLPAFESQVRHLADEVIDARREQVRHQFRLALAEGRALATIYVCRFHRITPVVDAHDDRVEKILETFNVAIAEEAAAFPNVRLVDTDEALRVVGAQAAVDWRFYLRGAAPYSTAFLDELARRIVVTSRGLGTHYRKAIVLDCDNTLWGGTIGEDLLDGIALDPYAYPGQVYWRVQHDLLGLQKAGVLLCLCSKNNPEDVDEVLRHHPHAVLRDEHFVLKRIDWSDKVAGLRQIAATLGIGLESLVFLDDSDFECMNVRTQLPAVHTVQVPRSLSQYPRCLAEIREVCLGGGITTESRDKTAQYRLLAMAEKSRPSFESHEAFLASLQLRVLVACDRRDDVARISELTMKSNQFNLVTRRRSPGDIEALMQAPDVSVYSIRVEDRFGSAGLTGVLTVRWQGDTAIVEDFLLSCRVLGRGIEHCVWRLVADEANRRGCRTLHARFVRTARNAQVADFYDRLGLVRSVEQPDECRYAGPFERVILPSTPWIEVVHGH